MVDATYTLLDINENEVLSYKNTENSNNDILQDLLEHKAYATALLYLNENYQLEIDKFENIFSKDNKVEDFFEDCETLLSRNVKIIEEAGIPLVDIKGYKIYETANGILRGNGKKKIYESFKTVKLEDLTADYLKNLQYSEDIEGYVVCPKCKSVINKDDNIFQTTEKDTMMYSTLDNPAAEKEVSYTVNNIACPICGAINPIEEFYIADTDNIIDAPNKKELVSDIDNLTEDTEGTQVSDIAPKLDQNMGLTKAKPSKHYDDILISDVDDNADKILNKGFMKNKDGHYQRGNYILVKENDNYIVIHKNKLNGGK